MTWAHSFGHLSTEQAAEERDVDPEVLARYSRVCWLKEASSGQHRSRDQWDYLIAELPMFETYLAVNRAGRTDDDIACRSADMFCRLSSMMNDERDRDADKQKGVRVSDSLKRIKENLLKPTQAQCATVDVSQMILEKLPLSVGMALSGEALEELYDRDSLLTPQKAVAVIDMLLASRGGPGRPPRAGVEETSDALRADYLWLTGLKAPDWTNSPSRQSNEDLSGPFIDFLKDCYKAAGWGFVSGHLLRGRRQSRRSK